MDLKSIAHRLLSRGWQTVSCLMPALNNEKEYVIKTICDHPSLKYLLSGLLQKKSIDPCSKVLTKGGFILDRVPKSYQQEHRGMS